MTALNLFPARIRFVNEDGTLTPEAYRALQIVFGRVGGTLGDSGTDVFGQVFGVANETGSLSALQTDVVQPANFGTDYYGDVVQYQASSTDVIGLTLPEVTQPLSREPGVFTTINASGAGVLGGTITTPGGASFHTTSTALTNGAGVGAGTLLTAPAAGNPTKWIGINDNGTIRYIPAW